ncbi:MAG: N-6 DNA methylase [Bacteroidetes bacterium]|nr:N-6 DNA methylase [Bacteroidota bacterium]
MDIQRKGNKIFAPLKNEYLIETPEETVRQEYIKHLVEYYGYSLDQMAQEVQVNNSKRGLGKARADILIWASAEDKKGRKKPIIVIECKAEQVSIRKDDYYQGANYASWAKAKFFVTTNLKNTKFFRVNEELLPDELDEIIEIPKANELTDKKRLEELANQTKTFTRDDFSKLLFRCHNIIRNNDKLSPEGAFDEISKILFMKIRYEREQATKRQLFSKSKFIELKKAHDEITGGVGKPFYQELFDRTKKVFENDKIFDENDSIKIRENSFLEIVKELEKYNLSDTSDDIKGIAFEEFLGKTFRGELGQFFTPRTIVNYIVDILDPQEGETICDPCCGSGGFLIRAFEYVREKIENEIQKSKDAIREQYYTDDFANLSEKKQEAITKKVEELFNQINYELDLQNPTGRLRTLSYNCIYGTDANPRMARTAKMNMIMHGDGHGGVHHHDGLLNVNGIFDNRFDVILTNPPFGARVEKTLVVSPLDIPTDEEVKYYTEKYKEYDYLNNVVAPLKEWANFDNGKGKGKPILDLFEVGKRTGLTEVLFIERCLNLLKPGGRMGIVLPEGVLNTSSLQSIRDYVEGKAKILNITSIPQDVFIASGATVKPSLLFLKKFTDTETEQYNTIVANGNAELDIKYLPLIEALETEYNAKAKEQKKADKKEYTEALKKLELQRQEDLKLIIKDKFDYEIAIVEVEKAGITSTGAECENELIDVAKEFKVYAKESNLWKHLDGYVKYDEINGEMKRTRVVSNVVCEPETIYEK